MFAGKEQFTKKASDIRLFIKLVFFGKLKQCLAVVPDTGSLDSYTYHLNPT